MDIIEFTAMFFVMNKKYPGGFTKKELLKESDLIQTIKISLDLKCMIEAGLLYDFDDENNEVRFGTFELSKEEVRTKTENYHKYNKLKVEDLEKWVDEQWEKGKYET